jgi:hypothetical protein
MLPSLKSPTKSITCPTYMYVLFNLLVGQLWSASVVIMWLWSLSTITSNINMKNAWTSYKDMCLLNCFKLLYIPFYYLSPSPILFFSFGHCVVCPSIYGFWLPFCYHQARLVSGYWLVRNRRREYFKDYIAYFEKSAAEINEKTDTHGYHPLITGK